MEPGKLLDTSLAISAPEYIVFRYFTAGPVSRLFAILIDFLLIFAIVIFVFIVYILVFTLDSLANRLQPGGLSDLATMVVYLLFFGLKWFYFIFFERFNRGRTPGKMMLSLRVVSVDGTALDMVQIMIRNLLRIADMFPSKGLSFGQLPTYLVGATTAVASGVRFQRLGDLAAGTVVVRTAKKNLRSNIGIVDSDRIQELASQLYMKKIPSATFTQAINDFVSSRNRLNPERLREIAGTVEKDLRKFFSAEQVQCTPEDLIYAVHHLLFKLPGDELTRLDLGNQVNL